MSEEWHKTHAVLLKSVAEAQGKLLAAQNSLESKLDNLHGIVEHNAMEQSGRLTQIEAGITAFPHIVAEEMADYDIKFQQLSGKLDALGNCLAGLLTLGAKPSTKRKPRGRRKS